MKRGKQVFVAPPDKDAGGLPLKPSPWHVERSVYLPKEQWDLLIEVAKMIDPAKAQMLESCSTSLKQDLTVYRSKSELLRLIDFVDNLAAHIASIPPLIPEPSEIYPEDYTNDEHVRMLLAVRTVLSEAARLGRPFLAWIE